MTTATQDTLTGTVKWFNTDKGYGFITTADCRDIFAHISQVSDECDDPTKGDRVNFIEDIGKDGRPYARRIVVVKENESV
jgi:CspA family cold shock protein